MAFLLHNDSENWWDRIVRHQMLNGALRESQDQYIKQAADPSQDQDETSLSVPLSSKLSPFFNNSKLSDITLMVGSSIFHSHKLILSSWSPIFKKMLLERKKTDEPHVLEEAQECEAIFSDFLRFMYTERIEMSKLTVYSFHKLAKKYEVGEICDLCEEFLMGEVSDECTALQMLNEAEEFGFTKVYDHCFKFLESNFFRISDQSVKKMSPSLFLKLLGSSDLVVKSERHLFSQALVWLTGGTRKDEYHEYTEEVISKTRLAHMTTSELSELKSAIPTHLLMYERFRQCLHHSLNDVFEWKALVSCEEELNRLQHHIRSTLFKRHRVDPRIYVPDPYNAYRNLNLKENLNNYSDGLSCPVTSVSANNTLSEVSSRWLVTGSTFYDQESKKGGIRYWFKPDTKHIDHTYRLVVLRSISRFCLKPIAIASKGVVTAKGIKVEQVLHTKKSRKPTSVRIKVVIMVKKRNSDHLMSQVRTRMVTEEDLRIIGLRNFLSQQIISTPYHNVFDDYEEYGHDW